MKPLIRFLIPFLPQTLLAQLTGRRFLDGYADDVSQYLALMNAGADRVPVYSLPKPARIFSGVMGSSLKRTPMAS